MPAGWSHQRAPAMKTGGNFPWRGGLYREKTVDRNSGSTYYMPGLRTNSPAFQYYTYYSGTPPGFSSLPPTQWYAYSTRWDYLQTTEFANIIFDVTMNINVQA